MSHGASGGYCGDHGSYAGHAGHGGDGHDPGHGNGRDGATDGEVLHGLEKDNEKVEVHIASHAPCDLRYQILQKIDALDLIRIDKYRGNLVPEDNFVAQLLPDSVWTDPPGKQGMPSGWYPGATGFTRWFREFLHIGRRDGVIFKGQLRPYFESHSYLEIECATRSYIETGDCQTHLIIRVRPLPEWSIYSQSWQLDEYWLGRHLEIARKLGLQVFSQVTTRYPVLPEAGKIRRHKRDLKQEASCFDNGEKSGGNAGTQPACAPGVRTVSGADLDNLWLW